MLTTRFQSDAKVRAGMARVRSHLLLASDVDVVIYLRYEQREASRLELELVGEVRGQSPH